MIVDRYYYHQLNKQEQEVYKAFYDGVMAHEEIIPIPVRCKFSQESFERIFMAMTRDNPPQVTCLDILPSAHSIFSAKRK